MFLKMGRRRSPLLADSRMAESSNQLCDARRFCKPCADDFSGHGFAEEMAVSFVAAMGLDLPHLLFGLDALGDHLLQE